MGQLPIPVRHKCESDSRSLRVVYVPDSPKVPGRRELEPSHISRGLRGDGEVPRGVRRIGSLHEHS